MAENVKEILEQSKTTVDKETRLRILKDRQNEERQRKLEEIKAQALAAQRFKEQKEAERRRRLEELRLKDEQRRLQVEEKKRAINEAERNRLEFILKRNQEREQRFEAKRRNERSNVVFAFGSSTPRMLEPTDVTVSFWGSRRATSIQNITTASNQQSQLTRRQSERDLDLAGKKRATSATGLERSTDGDGAGVSGRMPAAGCASGYVGRRRTDLVPTLPSRDSSFTTSSRRSLNQSPGRAYSMSRLDQLARPRRPHVPPPVNETVKGGGGGGSATSHVTRSMSHLSIHSASAGGNRLSRSVHHLPDASGTSRLQPRMTRAVQLREQKLHAAAATAAAAATPAAGGGLRNTVGTLSSNCSEASSRPSSSLSQQSTNSVASSVSVRHRMATTPRKPRPVSIAVTGISHDKEPKPPLPKVRSVSKTKEKVAAAKKAAVEEKAKNSDDVIDKPAEAPKKEDEPPVKKTESDAPKLIEVSNYETEIDKKEGEVLKKEVDVQKDVEQQKSAIETVELVEERLKDNTVSFEKTLEQSEPVNVPEQTIETKVEPSPPVEESDTNKVPEQQDSQHSENNEMTTSMTKVRISTEEEAKAAIAERRRQMREEAERQAELERLRKEAEARAELERQQKEEEQLRQLIEMQRQAEQERLQEAIREAQKREEEERLKKEEEQRLKLLKEEAERKAKEDAERQKAELQERLRNEEREREARRKRVEAIMLRTRGKNNANLSQSTDEKNENKSEENKVNEESKVNGAKIEQQENGTTTNDKKPEIVDNIMQEEIIKNANTIESISKSDSLNSNNTWRESQQYGNFVCNNNS